MESEKKIPEQFEERIGVISVGPQFLKELDAYRISESQTKEGHLVSAPSKGSTPDCSVPLTTMADNSIAIARVTAFQVQRREKAVADLQSRLPELYRSEEKQQQYSCSHGRNVSSTA